MTVRSAGAALAAIALTGIAVPAAADPPTVFTVTTTDDATGSGTACPATDTEPCTLRTAIADAAAASGPVTIVFGVAGPFALTNGSLQVTAGTVTIDGGDGLVTIHGANDRVFYVSGNTANLTLDHLKVTGGDATNSPSDDGFGGAIDVNFGGTLSVISTLITGNTANNDAGAIDDNTTSAVRIEDSTITGNSAGGLGGAIDTNTGANLTVINSTIAGNTAAGGGGAIDVVTGATVTLVNDTIAGNQAGTPGPSAPGGILEAANAALTITNTVLSGNSAPACAGAGATDGGHNAEDGTTCGFTSAAVSGAAALGPLQDNGGPTPTMAPAADSPLLGAGDRTVCAADTGAGAVDQRGVARPQPAAGCDIGAVETITTTTSVAADASVLPGARAVLHLAVHASSDLAGPPDGTVTVYDGATVLGTATSSGASTYTFTTGALAAGVHALRAVYGATSLFRGSEGSVAVTAAVPSTPPTTNNEGAATPAATQALAETGGSSAMPLVGLAMVAFGLAVAFVRRRRRL